MHRAVSRSERFRLHAHPQFAGRGIAPDDRVGPEIVGVEEVGLFAVPGRRDHARLGGRLGRRPGASQRPMDGQPRQGQIPRRTRERRLDVQERAQGVEIVGVAHDPRLVPLRLQLRRRQRLVALGGEERVPPGLVLETGERGFDFVHRGHHRPSVRGCGLVETALGKREIIPKPARLEDGRGKVRDQIREPLLRVEEVASVRACQPDGTGQRERRKQLGPARADAVAGRVEPLARCPHVGPLEQEVRRNPAGDGIRRKLRREGVGQDRLDILPIAAQENGQAGFGARELRLELRQPRLRVPEVLANLGQRPGIDQAAIVARRSQRLAFKQHPHRLAGQFRLAPQADDVEVRGDGLGQDADPRRVEVRLRGQILRSGGPRVVAGASPEVQLVGKIRADGIRRQVDSVRKHETRDRIARTPQPESPNLRADPGVRRRVGVGHGSARPHAREEVGPRDARPRASLPDARDARGEVEVGDEHGIDDGVEHRIPERRPPLQRLVRPRLKSGREIVRHLRHRLRKGRPRSQGTGGEKQERGRPHQFPHTRYSRARHRVLRARC